MSSPHIQHNNAGQTWIRPRRGAPSRPTRPRPPCPAAARPHVPAHPRRTAPATAPSPVPRAGTPCAPDRPSRARASPQTHVHPQRPTSCPQYITHTRHDRQRGDVQRSNAPQSIRHPALCEDGAREHDRVLNACRLVSVVRCGNGLKKRERARDCADAPKVARAPVHDSGIAFDGTLKRQIGAVACKRGENVGIARTATNLRLDSRHLRGP